VSKTLQMKVLGAVALLVAGTALTGCKSAPELTESQALSLIQAKYDQSPPVSITLLVDDLGMRQGATGKLWDRTKMYPNKIWADFKLTPDGKKAVTLPSGGDVIEWRPSDQNDKDYTIRITTAAVGKLKAYGLQGLSDEMIEGAGTVKGGDYNEVVDTSGLPEALQQIARNPGNRLVTRRHADFSLDNGTWTLHGIK
jgi:hypothetical protein